MHTARRCACKNSLGGGRSDGVALDQLMRYDVIEHDARLALFTTTNALLDEVDRGGRHGGNRLTDRRELGPNRRCRGSVVETDDRQIARHIEPAPMRDGHDGRGHVVVACEFGGWWALAIEQFLRCFESRAISEESLMY